MKKTYRQKAYGKYKNIKHFINALGNVYKYKNPGKRIYAIGVTGTDGKTTTSALIYHILKKANKKVALINTLGAYIGGKRLNTGLHVTSPDSEFIQRFLSRLVSRKYEYVVLESTSHGLDQHRLLGVNFKIGVLTNLTHEHLDYHGSMQNYAKAKAKLFRTTDVAIINKNEIMDVDFETLIKRKNLKIIDLNLKWLDKHYNLKKAITTRFGQKYNQLNAISASQVALTLGISETVICNAILNFPDVEGRFQKIPNSQGVNAYIDFAHTPHALEELLSYLGKNTGKKNKLIVLFGCAGARDIEKRPLMGEIASRYSDVIVLTSEDPRFENPMNIIDSIKIGIDNNKKFKGKVFIQQDRKKAIDLAVSLSSRGDTLVLCGKGHETSMNILGIEHKWSDKRALTASFLHKH